MAAWIIPVLSTLKSILPAFTSFTTLPISVVTVPVLGFGIRLRGPRIFPSLPNLAIIAGMVTITSTSVHPPSIFLIYSSNPTKSAPASLASASFSGVHNTSTFLVLPVPCGRATTPRTIWFDLRGSTPKRMSTSTDASNLVVVSSFTSFADSFRLYCFVRSYLVSTTFLFLLIVAMITS